MIIQSPESEMPEPFKTYVSQRSKSIGKVLVDIVGEDNVQLCPSAITVDQQLFTGNTDHTYGVVVKNMADGYKSALYSPDSDSLGIATKDQEKAAAYTAKQFNLGNRVRIKDVRESDGQGQYTVDSLEAMLDIFNDTNEKSDFGSVLMPSLNNIQERISVGRISLGRHGDFGYVGREESINHDGREVYGGTTLGLYRSDDEVSKALAEEYFEIPPRLTAMANQTLDRYSKQAIKIGRVSVDVIEGITDNGSVLRDVIDLTPRIGGTTPAETLAMRELHLDNKTGLCIASSRLLYNPTSSPTTGTNFVDTSSLVINAQIHETRNR